VAKKRSWDEFAWCDVNNSRAHELLLEVGANDIPDFPGDVAVEGGKSACFLLGNDGFNLRVMILHIVKAW
jgi:hypothetical protein